MIPFHRLTACEIMLTASFGLMPGPWSAVGDAPAKRAAALLANMTLWEKIAMRAFVLVPNHPCLLAVAASVCVTHSCPAHRHLPHPYTRSRIGSPRP